MAKNVIVIGGGIIGLCSAYYLKKEGCQVTVIDKSTRNEGASYVNAGYLTPSHIIPLAAPGMISKGFKYMFNSASSFYIKPRLDSEFLSWAWAFKKSSTKAKVAKAIPHIRDINIFSRELYDEIMASKELGPFHYERKGLLMLYQTNKEGDHEKETALIVIAMNKIPTIPAHEYKYMAACCFFVQKLQIFCEMALLKIVKRTFLRE